jgi:hypothetical protein
MPGPQEAVLAVRILEPAADASAADSRYKSTLRDAPPSANRKRCMSALNLSSTDSDPSRGSSRSKGGLDSRRKRQSPVSAARRLWPDEATRIAGCSPNCAHRCCGSSEACGRFLLPRGVQVDACSVRRALGAGRNLPPVKPFSTIIVASFPFSRLVAKPRGDYGRERLTRPARGSG